MENEFEQAMRMQRAFNELVCCLIDTGDNHRRDALDIQMIAEQIADRTEASVRGETVDWADDTKRQIRSMRESFIAEHMAGKDAATIAQALNLKRTTVERVIRKLLVSDDTEPLEKLA